MPIIAHMSKDDFNSEMFPTTDKEPVAIRINDYKRQGFYSTDHMKTKFHAVHCFSFVVNSSLNPDAELTFEQATEILTVIRKAKSEERAVFIHYSQGECRSATIARFAALMFEYDHSELKGVRAYEDHDMVKTLHKAYRNLYR